MSATKQAVKEPQGSEGDILAESNPNAPDPSAVPVQEQYIFAEYQDNLQFRDPMSIDHMFAPGFNPAGIYQFKWFLYTEQEKAESRYFTKVIPAVHGKWFKDGSFNKVRGGIVLGEEYLNGKEAEMYLYVRAAAAGEAESQQMMALGNKARHPETNEEYQKNAHEMNAMLADTGGGIRDTSGRREVKSGWPRQQ